MAKKKKEESTYDAKNIKSFEGTEAIRKRYGMYVGVGEAALTQMAYEILSNSVDEALAGHASTVSVTITKDSCEVSDDGRGIPWQNVDVKGEKVPACIQASLSTHAGGKFDNDAYAVSGGTNGKLIAA